VCGARLEEEEKEGEEKEGSGKGSRPAANSCKGIREYHEYLRRYSRTILEYIA
jgi:hypothetical protein